MSDWYSTVKKKNDFILKAITEHPFIKELIEGTLAKDVFEFYIKQDAIYLSEYKKVLARIGTKCDHNEHAAFFLDAAMGTIQVENELHQTFLKEQTKLLEPSPTCELYTSYLAKATCFGSLEESLAAVLPCFTIYKDVGDYILKNQKNKGSNIYQDWIDTYSGEDFALSVQQAIEITNKYAKYAPKHTLEKMNLAFNKASRLEWLFWDSAYTKEAWKL